MLTALIIMYLIMGAMVAREQMREDDDEIEQAKRFYPSYTVFLAMVIAFVVLVIIWPYVVYEELSKGEDS